MLATRARRGLIFAVSLVPLVIIVTGIARQTLGADPAKAVVVFTGEWALYFLFITLCVTPLKKWLHWRWLAPHRRMLGLFALFYASLHLLAFFAFILGFDLSRLVTEFIERPYISVGLPAYLLLVALGVTSTQAMMRRLGKRWVKLHQGVYLALVLAWVHVLWQVRASYFEATVYAGIGLCLLGIRLVGYGLGRVRAHTAR